VKYQDLCDEVFGEDVVDIRSVDSVNAVLMHLIFVNMFETFYEHLKALLERLKEKMTSEEDKEKLIKTVEQVADPLDGELAYAKLVIWDKLWQLIQKGCLDPDKIAIDLIYDTENMNPYDMAEEHRLMVMEKFGDEIMDEDKHLVVLVKAPWNNEKCCESDIADAIYYRSMARRTFIEYYSDDETELSDISDYYDGDALVKDAIEQLNGIIVIDMTAGGDNDHVVIHSFKNPHSKVMTKEVDAALLVAVLCGDECGMYENFESDNY
jgi:hypothetical protein